MKLTQWQLARLRKEHPKRGGFWYTLLAYAILFVVSELLRPKPNIENAKPAGLGDFQFPTATKDRVVPIMWGTVRLKGPNVVWYGDLRRDAITKKVKTGLFSGSKQQTVGYRYSLGIQMGLTRGVLDELVGIWVGEKRILSDTGLRNIRLVSAGTNYQVGDELTLTGGSGTSATIVVTNVFIFFGIITDFYVKSAGEYTTLPASGSTLSTTGGSGSGATFSQDNGTLSAGDTLTIDLPNFFGGDEEGNGGISGTLKFFSGTATQAVSSYLSEFQLEGGKTPAYRGTSYLTCDADPFYLGNSPSIKPWSFEIRRIPNGLSLTSGREVVNLKDANPANVLYELLTNTEWGFSHLATDIDTTSFVDAGNTLYTENNGFSMLLDRQMEASELRSLIEEQISGRVFFNMATGKWQLKLARADYVLNDLPVISEANALEIRDFTRGSWEETTNIVTVKFSNREDEYQTDFALAQDSANIQRQDGALISTTVNAPGVKDSGQAADQAWRTLRTLSYPLAKARFVMDRTFWDTNPVDVFAFTSTRFGLTKLPMRVTRVDLGSLEDNKVILDVVQDVFFFQVASFAGPGGTGWTDPIDGLLPFLADEQLAFEAPRGLAVRTEAGLPEPLVFAAARRRGNESSFLITARDSSGTPSGSFAAIGDSVGFMRIGELSANLSKSQTSPTATITLTNAVDSQARILDAFDRPLGSVDQGTNLVNLIYVTDGTNDGEFMLVETVSPNGGSNVDLETVYRGVLDSAQQDFTAGDSVFLIFAGANVADTSIIEDNNVHVKLLPRSSSDLVASADATQISFTMDKRARRPYCPAEVSIGSTIFASTVSLEQQGSGLDGVGFSVDFIRRDYRAGNEIPQLTTDAETLFPDFPAANSTDHDMEVREDPGGTNTLLITDVDIVGTSNDKIRTDILHANAGVLPTRLSVVLTAKHNDGADTDLTSRQSLVHEFNVTSALTGHFELGDLLRNVASATYTVDAAVAHTVTIGTAFAGGGAGTGNVEININGGGWNIIIPQGSTSGVTAALSVSDTIQIRHDSTDTDHVTMMTLTGSGATSAWGILYV